jgi:hypothetical protein
VLQSFINSIMCYLPPAVPCGVLAVLAKHNTLLLVLLLLLNGYLLAPCIALMSPAATAACGT